MKEKNRLERVRSIVDKVIRQQPDKFESRCGFVHLYGVSYLCGMLAIKRGIDPELASVAGMLHDIYTYRTKIIKFHAHNSSEDARVILRDLGDFTKDEQLTITKAIFRHSDKDLIHEPFDELLKDADVLQHYLYNTKFPVGYYRLKRLKKVFAELGLDSSSLTVHSKRDSPQKNDIKHTEILVNIKELIADIAEDLANKNIVGSLEDKYFKSIIRYYPGPANELINGWCAAFVYHCCMEAGLFLPIKYPDPVSCRFAGVKSWLQWSQLRETNFYHSASDPSFIPSRGDIIIFDNIIGNGPHDHIGIVLSDNDGILTTAEGNINNKSGILKRDRYENVNGFIRISDSYEYK